MAHELNLVEVKKRLVKAITGKPVESSDITPSGQLADTLVPVVAELVGAGLVQAREEVDRLTSLLAQYADRGIANGKRAEKAEGDLDAITQRFLTQAETIKELTERIAQYEEGVTWGTTCLGCARILTSSYADRVWLEKLFLGAVKAIQAAEFQFKCEDSAAAWEALGDWHRKHGHDGDGFDDCAYCTELLAQVTEKDLETSAEDECDALCAKLRERIEKMLQEGRDARGIAHGLMPLFLARSSKGAADA